jgi:hypothetical protein
MAPKIRIRQLPWRRSLGALLTLLALVAAIMTLVVILREPVQPLPWLMLSGLIVVAGYGAHLARRR